MLEVAIRLRVGNFDLDVEFQAGQEITAIFGPSGAGKTLTLRAIAGIVEPVGGRIAFNGRSLTEDGPAGVSLPPQERRIGYVPQSYALFPHLSVGQNIGAGLHALGREARRGRVAEMIAMMDIKEFENRRPHELSGGQKQRVALARALAPKPDLLLLDEPFAALDALLHRELHDQLLEVQRRLGMTVLLVTHNREDVQFLARRVVVLDGGRVLQAGSCEELVNSPASERVARLFRGLIPSSDLQ